MSPEAPCNKSQVSTGDPTFKRSFDLSVFSHPNFLWGHCLLPSPLKPLQVAQFLQNTKVTTADSTLRGVTPRTLHGKGVVREDYTGVSAWKIRRETEPVQC